MFGKFLDSEEAVGRKGMSKGEKSEEGDLGLWRRRHCDGLRVQCHMYCRALGRWIG